MFGILGLFRPPLDTGTIVTRQGGPFVGVVKSEKLDKLIDTAILIFPDGPPMRGCTWESPGHIPPSVYIKWFKDVLGRTVPTPISNAPTNNCVPPL